jgi:hypothetical protein
MANEIYLNRGTTIAWLNTAGDEQLDLGDGVIGLTTAVGVGSYHDFSAAPQPDEYELVIDIDGFDTAPVVGETVDVYVTESTDASLWTGPEAPNDTTDSTGATVRLPNLKYVGSAVVHTTTAADNLTAMFVFRSSARYIAPVVHNNTADDLLTTADAHRVNITPIYYQGQ